MIHDSCVRVFFQSASVDSSVDTGVDSGACFDCSFCSDSSAFIDIIVSTLIITTIEST